MTYETYISVMFMLAMLFLAAVVFVASKIKSDEQKRKKGP